jgi:predicted RNA-binding protein
MVNYWLDLFTPETWEEARARGFKVTGFRSSRWSLVSKIQPGDLFVCYLTKYSRLCGILEAVSQPYQDDNKAKQIWKGESFPCLIDVEPLTTFDPLHSVPRDQIIPKLSIADKFGGIIRGSPNRIPFDDGELIRKTLAESQQKNVEYPVLKKITGRRYERPPKTQQSEVTKESGKHGGEKNLHDTILDSLVTIGEIFGYQPIRKPSVNDLRPPNQPFKAKGKTLDLAWEIFGLTHIPFEVQVHGSVPDLIYRLNLVHQWSLKIVIVADQEWHEEIKEAAQVYPFAGKLVMLTPKEIDEAKKDYIELRNLRRKIFA